VTPAQALQQRLAKLVLGPLRVTVAQPVDEVCLAELRQLERLEEPLFRVIRLRISMERS
jgi:hypothetical protein